MTMAKKQSKAEPVEAAEPPVNCAHSMMAKVADLKPHPRNPNRHPPGQIALLAKNIAVLGWRHPIIVSKRSGLIVAGHARLEAAKTLGMKQAPVDMQDYESAADEMAVMVADNRLAELAEMDLPGLKDILQELDTGAFDMDLTGFDLSALEGLMNQVPPEPNSDDAKADQDHECPKCGHTW